MRHGSLFSGIGGFDLAAEWMGWENVFHCENNPFGKQVLQYYWPNAITYDDIKETDFTIHRGRIDILSGGFPCLAYSQAGKRLGKEDERHLWPEMLRAIQQIKPTYVVGENVRGLINWSGGLVFEEVQTDLESIGYEVQPFLLPAASVGAPHKRDRVWFIAYSKSNGSNRASEKTSGKARRSNRQQIEQPSKRSEVRDASNANSKGLSKWIRHGFRQTKREDGTFQGGQFTRAFAAGERWGEFPTVSPVCSRYDGVPDRLDGITFSKWRNESIKAGGNAVVPQLVYQIFKAIQEDFEASTSSTSRKKNN